MRKPGQHPSYYKKYKYPRRYYRVTVITVTDAVEERGYTGINKSVPRKLALNRTDALYVTNVVEITFDEYSTLIKNGRNKYATKRICKQHH